MIPPEQVFSAQKRFFLQGRTRDTDFRIRQLKKLEAGIRALEKDILEAIRLDLGKSSFEAFCTELGVVYQELKLALKKTRKWSSPVRVRTSLINWPGKSRIIPEPYGTVLILGAWNYPFQLTLAPLIPALAAGNTAVIKPGETASRTSGIIARLINSCFEPEYVHVLEGGADLASDLVDMPFDKIFFTGSTRVGRMVMARAARNLTPATLELGGKSPVLILSDADLDAAARRIAWGKVINSGQTCIAPDHVLVHESRARELIKLLSLEFDRYIRPGHADFLPRIINAAHFDRLDRLVDPAKVAYGSIRDRDRLFFSPTILYPSSFDDPCMQEEIFGPVLPVIPYQDQDRTLEIISSLPRPLAFYLFTSSTRTARRIMNQVSFGGGAVNDVIMHAAGSDLPFGGVGSSGMGRYHGQAGFREFSNYKSILFKPARPDPGFRYPPWSAWKYRLARWFWS
ncbi:aldehyde dehydrogenase family protein [Desulfonatronovibrio hydrogenovorans]|uniref:aldehyde dehydrogenase family protein n=1 Tax=Desulfonatronovibrio hydrogenovorans TaxID=53245 RepID=UPI000552CA78|nr:aldehyde dehydrogenase family protein [Desulfonatronovibrio hydrogenovorans]